MRSNNPQETGPSIWARLRRLFSNRDSVKGQVRSDPLIIIQDYPNSPLSGWKHFGILKHVEGKIHKKLKDDGYEGSLIGLRVSYGQPNPDDPQDDKLANEYTMAYGYGIENEEPLNDEEDPLADDFMLDLYDEISELIRQNARPTSGNFIVSLETSLNPKPMKNKIIEPRICKQGQCPTSEHVGKKVKMCSTDSRKTWYCIHKKKPK